MRPYVSLVILAVALSVVCAGARTARAWLLEPLFDQVLVPHQQSGVSFTLKELGGSLLGRNEEDKDARADDEKPQAAEQQLVREKITTAIPRIVLATLLLVLLLPLANFGQEVLTQWVLGRVLVDLQQQLCEKLLALPLRFHLGQSRGDTLSRVMNDAQKAHQSLDLMFQDVAQ